MSKPFSTDKFAENYSQSCVYLFILWKAFARDSGRKDLPRDRLITTIMGRFWYDYNIYLTNDNIKKHRYYKLFMRATAKGIGLSAYDVKNGAIGSSLICPFYLPKNKGTTNSTSMRDVISLIYDRLQWEKYKGRYIA